ncbi:MAG: pyridoxal-phosphate dependent enzyme, partial [Actinomycetota bacterium]|nr:pyridoxal-phosphate dependent enzyme [Actinomycetota bacterium]
MTSTLHRRDVEAAAARISPYLRRTPLLRVEIEGRPVLLKCEHMQVSGSFKARGATNAVVRARESGAAAVVAASGGNHGLGVAVA